MVEGFFDYSLWGLFLASFLAATVVPFSSEALLTFLIINGTDAYTAVLVATAGNWLGGMSSYAIGYMGKWVWIEKYLRIERETIEKWHDRLYRKGAIFAFLSWVPAVGDIFAVGLGLLRSSIPITAFALLYVYATLPEEKELTPPATGEVHTIPPSWLDKARSAYYEWKTDEPIVAIIRQAGYRGYVPIETLSWRRVVAWSCPPMWPSVAGIAALNPSLPAVLRTPRRLR